MQYWNDGILGEDTDIRYLFDFGFVPIIPLFHYSIIPMSQAD
jgi:hypothetical protein